MALRQYVSILFMILVSVNRPHRVESAWWECLEG